jgi:gliding motility-associated-like protein
MKLIYTISILLLVLCEGRAQDHTCPPNIGFEDGSFTNWKCYTGNTFSQGIRNVINVSVSPPSNNRHTLITSATATDPYGLFPINPPDGSGYAVKLGNNVNGKQAERITYQFTVPTNNPNASLIYRYAVVFEDPGHAHYDQPRFTARVRDVQTNAYLPCASSEYIATASLPGFSTSPVNRTVKYKPWSAVYMNLGAYPGRVLELEFTTADCTQGQHWGYAYIDVGDCNISASVRYDCNPNIATFKGPPGFDIYDWYDASFGTLLGSGENLVLNPAPAIRTVNVVVYPFNGFGCSDTLQVSFFPILPEAKAGPDTLVCPGKGITIGSPPGKGFTYSWAPAQYLSDSTSASPVATVPQPTTFIVTATSIESTCIDRDTVTLGVFDPIEVAVSPDQVICEGQQIKLMASGTATSFKWSPAQSLSHSNIPNPVAKPLVTTTYQVIGYDNHQCFQDTGEVKVVVNPAPKIELGPDVVLSTGSTHQFTPITVKGPIVSWLWSPAENLSCTACETPTAEVKKNMTYRAAVTNEFGCTAIDSVNIKPFCNGSQVFIPNAFTPDGDGLNDILLVRGKGIALVRSFRIYSRWGELVFERRNFLPNDPSFGWDGKIKGVTGAPEVYVFTAEVVCENDLIYTYKGNATLLK